MKEPKFTNLLNFCLLGIVESSRGDLLSVATSTQLPGEVVIDVAREIQSIKKTRPGSVLIKLAGVDTSEKAQSLRGKEVWGNAVPEEEKTSLGYLYTLEGEKVGPILAIENFGASDTIVVSSNGKTLRLPLIEDYVNQSEEFKYSLKNPLSDFEDYWS